MDAAPGTRQPKNPKKSLDEREKAFEAKYQLDDAIAFKAAARRAKLLGLWVAGRLGLAGDDALAYAWSAVEADLADPGHATLFARLGRDLVEKAGEGADAGLAEEFARLAPIAREQAIAEAQASKPAS
jgi:hypothetical protein